jgi:hypothetical protein
VTYQVRGGWAWVIAYEPITTKVDVSLTASLRRRLVKTGLRATRRGFRNEWLPALTAADAIEALYGRPVRARIEKMLRKANVTGASLPFGDPAGLTPGARGGLRVTSVPSRSY